MSKGEKYNDKSDKIKKFTLKLTMGYIIILILCIAITSGILLQKTTHTLTNRVQTFLSALNVQMQLNIDNYLDKLESNGTLIFSDEEIYTYSPMDTSLDEYGKVLLETEISNRLFEFSITENFCDYGIVYSNDHTVGKISNATIDITQGETYSTLESIVTRENTNDGWCTNLNGNFKRLYYVKRINPNAILVTSFYTDQLQNTFKHLDYLEDMSIELVNQDNQIMYSSTGNVIGSTLDDRLLSIIGDNVSTSIADDDYVISINTCGDGWKIVSYIPTSTVVKENSKIVVSITLVVCVLLVVSIVATVILFKSSSSKIDNTVHGLIQKADFDQLTNVLNKNAFYEHTENVLSKCKVTDNYAFLMLDVDNFKGVNDTLGHIYGDKVLANVGAILRNNFPMDEHIVGRLGGDEFAVFINVPDDITDVHKYLEDRCQLVCKDFYNNYSGDNHDYKISASIGVAMYPKHGKNFESLYNSADTALYHSKRRGKDTFTIYNSSLESGEL